jgi:hypothetical protein
LPWPSASTWISIWRGWVTNFSMNMRSSPKLDAGLVLRRLETLAHLILGPRDAHALAAAARADAFNITG